MGKRTWSRSDDDRLRRLYLELAPQARLNEIAEIMGRTASSIRHRASRLGIADQHHPRSRGEAHVCWAGGQEATKVRLRAKREAERRARGARRQRSFTQAEDDQLAAICATMPIHEVAALMGRSVGSIGARMQRLGLKGRDRSWQQRGPANHNWKGGRSASYRRSKYKLEPGEYERILEAQGGVCLVCLSDGSGARRGFHVDHDHETGQVRGILCHHCNLLLGNAKEEVKILRRAADYLEGFRSVTA